MLGVVAGDIAGSRFEWENYRWKDFLLFAPDCRFTDDTVMSAAICDALMVTAEDRSKLRQRTVVSMQEFGHLYPDVGYGGYFKKWLRTPDPKPYYSIGNGSAMRVSACGWAGQNSAEVKAMSSAVSGVTHNHPNGLKGAEAVAIAVYMARSGADMDDIQAHITKSYYTITKTLDEIRPVNTFNATCEVSVPQAFEAFFESVDFEDAVRNAVSIGGDSDTIAAITGSIAEAYYGIPGKIRNEALSYLDPRLAGVFLDFEKEYGTKIADD